MNTDAGRGEIRAEVRSGVGWVTLSRPEKRNALTTAMWTALPGVVHALIARDDLVAIVLQGAEGTFGAGADLEDVVAATAGRTEATEYCTRVVTALLAVATAPLPTLALVAGVAAGGGAELALACDLRVAEQSASFAFPFARLGVVPDRFTLERLVATVGATRARRLVFTGETVDATLALSIGLVDEVTDEGGLAAAAVTWAESLRQGSRSARIGMKRVLAGDETRHDVTALVRPMVDSIVGGEVRAAALRFLEKRGS
jgi:enoyl-CoA hydratase/carnithine racemase